MLEEILNDAPLTIALSLYYFMLVFWPSRFLHINQIKYFLFDTPAEQYHILKHLVMATLRPKGSFASSHKHFCSLYFKSSIIDFGTRLYTQTSKISPSPLQIPSLKKNLPV